MNVTVENESAMIDLGRDIGAKLNSGDILALVGDLGAGKTHFTKGIVSGLESAADVTSPTFSLTNEYTDGRLPVFHFDFYRLDAITDLEQIGWEEYLDQEGVLIVEWADKYPQSLPEETVWYRFTTNDDGSRSISTD